MNEDSFATQVRCLLALYATSTMSPVDDHARPERKGRARYSQPAGPGRNTARQTLRANSGVCVRLDLHDPATRPKPGCRSRSRGVRGVDAEARVDRGDVALNLQRVLVGEAHRNGVLFKSTVGETWSPTTTAMLCARYEGSAVIFTGSPAAPPQLGAESRRLGMLIRQLGGPRRTGLLAVPIQGFGNGAARSPPNERNTTMLNRTLLVTAALSLVGLGLTPTPARAGISDSLGTWEGSGTATEVSGKDLGAFTVALTRKSIGNAKVRADGKVTLASGQQIVFWQEFEDHGQNGFKLVSNHGSGGGHCFANGMCQLYEQRADGHAFATTIAKDGADKLRVLVTELDGGKAVRFFQQTLSKKP